VARMTTMSDEQQPTLEQIERREILTRLLVLGGRMEMTAKSLDIGIRTLQIKLKKWGITREMLRWPLSTLLAYGPANRGRTGESDGRPDQHNDGRDQHGLESVP
jgi:hypothetical protein